MILILIGSIVVLVCFSLFVTCLYLRFNRQIDNDIQRVLNTPVKKPVCISEDMLTNLPAPVSTYLRYSGILGTSIPRIVRIKQKGVLRSDPSSPWKPIEAEEVYAVGHPSFVWKACMPTYSLPVVMGRDEYLGGKGSISMKMAACIPVAEEQGTPLNLASLLRYLNEMMWFPQAYLLENISWKARNNSSSDVTLHDHHRSVTGTLFFDTSGRIRNFTAPRFNAQTHRIETWQTPISKYGEFQHIRVPVAGSAAYNGTYHAQEYIRLRVTDIQYEQ